MVIASKAPRKAVSEQASAMKDCSLSHRLVMVSILLVGTRLACADDRVPVQASLVHSLEAGRIKVGDSVLAKVTARWKSSECDLRQGAILKGRVVAQTARSKTDKYSQIALLFESGECGGSALKPIPLTVAAVMAANPRLDPNLYQSPPLNDAVGLTLNGNARSLTSAAAAVFSQADSYKGPTSIRPGEVAGIKGLQLKVGEGPEGSSILSASGHNVRLDAGAQLVLVPNVAAGHSSADSAAVTLPSPPVTAAPPVKEIPEPADETDICSPPQCSVALATGEGENANAAASATLSIKDLGYSLIDRERFAFDYDSAVVFLGEKKLLFTFNPHILVPRNSAEAKFAKLRIIRAVLIDVATKNVQKTVDWKVPDDGQYLWSIGRDRVLVHVGRELRIYGPDLRVEQRLALSGPLAFVRASPSASYFAVGVIQERHSEAVHRELLDAEAREPEEDVEVKVLDANLRTLATTVHSSRAAPPVFSDKGEIRTQKIRKNRWRISEATWDSQQRNIAELNSTCAPRITTLLPDFLFVIGCDLQASGKWYRVLRSNGKPVLKGWSNSAELEQRVSSADAGNSFTVSVAVAVKSINASYPFRVADIAAERIAVYRAENGGRIFSLNVPAPIPTVQSFVLSPNGQQLAVLQGDQIALYAMSVPALH
jgi:hypothetical protein